MLAIKYATFSLNFGEVFRRLSKSTSVKLFFDLALKKFLFFFMASNFSVIPIRWLLTVDSEIAFFLFHSFAVGVLASHANVLTGSSRNHSYDCVTNP